VLLLLLLLLVFALVLLLLLLVAALVLRLLLLLLLLLSPLVPAPLTEGTTFWRLAPSRPTRTAPPANRAPARALVATTWLSSSAGGRVVAPGGEPSFASNTDRRCVQSLKNAGRSTCTESRAVGRRGGVVSACGGEGGRPARCQGKARAPRCQQP
jgi:hypothetical protein